MNPLERQYLTIYKAAAQDAGHPWPGAAAAEAWNETGGQPPMTLPHMPKLANGSTSYNCLGIKAGRKYTGATVTADGTEQMADGEFTGPEADAWRVYPSFMACFADQLRILKTEGGGKTYAAALAAKTPEDYIEAECPVWSTNRDKAAEVLATYKAHADILG